MIWDWSYLATVNAFLNAVSFVFLVTGYRAIKRGDENLHERMMKAAGIATLLFLTSYLTYHYKVGHVHFNGTGIARTIYFLVLFTHLPLAALNAVLASITFWHAHKENWEKHKRIAKITFPIWIYVSVTGVIIYVMVYHLYAAS